MKYVRLKLAENFPMEQVGIILDLLTMLARRLRHSQVKDGKAAAQLRQESLLMAEICHAWIITPS